MESIAEESCDVSPLRALETAHCHLPGLQQLSLVGHYATMRVLQHFTCLTKLTVQITNCHYLNLQYAAIAIVKLEDTEAVPEAGQRGVEEGRRRGGEGA